VTISTHVLDAAAGSPARGVTIALERSAGGGWSPVAAGTTDHDGRCPQLAAGLELAVGTYRMRFDSGAYFAATGTPTFYPLVEITFAVTDPHTHYHVPLLLSPFAYSTYRGS
jgi:5-hydroxyisourate hydrolase